MNLVSMDELKRKFGVVSKSKKGKPKPMKCSKCGANMVAHPGTNIYTCPGMVEAEEKTEAGVKKVQKPCGNYLMRNYIIK